MERPGKAYVLEMVREEVEFILLEEAEGAIEARNDQQERLEEFTSRVGSGEFHRATDYTLPCGCIDGRCGCTLKPNAAGGTESLMVADDLTNQQFRSNDKTTLGAYRNVLAFLKKNGYPIGGHDDDNAGHDKSGCGANDKLSEIYNIVTRKPEVLRGLAETLGVKVSDETHELITKRASERTTFSSGPELRTELDHQSSGAFDHLEGSHNEVMAVINLRQGTTLDRDALREEFGPTYQAFNIDVWSFPAAANLISTTDDSPEQEQKIAAMAYYNLATALVLCGTSMRVVVLE